MNIVTRWWNWVPAQAGDASQAEGDLVACDLCIHACRMEAGQWGYCGARFNDGTGLASPYLGRFSSVAVDPIEKKPLHHWRPGSHILSLGSLGCTMCCPFCQNHDIARPVLGPQGRRLTAMPPETLLAHLRKARLAAVAYTYNEPALQAEYILAAAPLLRENGIATVLVSNGMYSETLLRELAPVVDAANIDVKAFNARAYADMGGNLKTVKRTVSHLLSHGTHVEVTTLVVPGVSDSPEEFAGEVDWLASLSPDIPLHISRYHPAHKFTAPPTDVHLLQRFAAMAREKLRHVHIGNVPLLSGSP